MGDIFSFSNKVSKVISWLVGVAILYSCSNANGDHLLKEKEKSKRLIDTHVDDLMQSVRLFDGSSNVAIVLGEEGKEVVLDGVRMSYSASIGHLRESDNKKVMSMLELLGCVAIVKRSSAKEKEKPVRVGVEIIEEYVESSCRGIIYSDNPGESLKILNRNGGEAYLYLDAYKSCWILFYRK